jgi:hypothetical protein
MPPFHLSKQNTGELYIGVVIALGIFSIVSVALITLLVISFNLMTYAKARITARNIAEDAIETIRNMTYDDIGTSFGIPSGIVEPSRQISRNGLIYTIKTDIVYIDDPYDGTVPNDLLPNDYKRIRIDVSWGGLTSSKRQPMTLLTDIAPKNAESMVNAGTLSILVFDSASKPVSQALVTINSETTNPPIHINQRTNINGRVVLPGAPICSDCYNISVTKEGYSTDKTYSETEVSHPSKPYLSIRNGRLTEISFTIDKTSPLVVTTLGSKELGFPRLPFVPFTIIGNKSIGTDIADISVPKYIQNFTTDANGTITIPNLEWDNYTITISEDALLDVSYSSPLLPFSILSGIPSQVSMSLVPHSQNSLHVAFVDQTDSLVSTVSAELLHNNESVASGSAGLVGSIDAGQFFYPNLLRGMYQFVASPSGYATYSGTLNVVNSLYQKITLSPIL